MKWPSIITAVGLFGLAVYQLSQGQFTEAFTTVGLALGALGLGFNHSAIVDVKVAHEDNKAAIKAIATTVEEIKPGSFKPGSPAATAATAAATGQNFLITPDRPGPGSGQPRPQDPPRLTF